jgi:hypothetical protein
LPENTILGQGLNPLFFFTAILGRDLSFHPHLDRKQVMGLFDLDFLSRHENVIFLGPPGVGKTHLATALAIKACYAGMSIYFTTMAELMDKLKKDVDSLLSKTNMTLGHPPCRLWAKSPNQPSHMDGGPT